MFDLIQVRDGRLAVKVYTPAVAIGEALLVHGYTGSKEDFDLLAPLLADRGFRVAAFDQRGYHDSEPSERPDAYEVPEHAADAVAVADALGMVRPHLLGHSFGGLVAQHAAVQAPGRWQSLTLFCSGPGRLLDRPDLEHNIAFLADHDMAAEWEHRAPTDLPAARVEFLKQRWLATDRQAIRRHAAQLLGIDSVVSQLAATGLPVHVVYGEFDDAWPIPEQLAMADDLAGQVSMIPGVGHCPNEEAPEVTAGVLSEFWLAGR